MPLIQYCRLLYVLMYCHTARRMANLTLTAHGAGLCSRQGCHSLPDIVLNQFVCCVASVSVNHIRGPSYAFTRGFQLPQVLSLCGRVITAFCLERLRFLTGRNLLIHSCTFNIFKDFGECLGISRCYGPQWALYDFTSNSWRL